MKKSILNLEGTSILSKEQLKNTNGGLYNTWCRRRSDNVIGGSTTDWGYQNSNGCWVYLGMCPDSHPSYPPGTSSYAISCAGWN